MEFGPIVWHLKRGQAEFLVKLILLLVVAFVGSLTMDVTCASMPSEFSRWRARKGKAMRVLWTPMIS